MFFLKRLVHATVVVLGVSVVVFVLTRMSIDPAKRMLGPSASEEQYQNLRHQLGFARPLPEQFGEFVSDTVRLRFGESLLYGRDVMAVIQDRIAATLKLTAAGLGLAALVGIPAGLRATRRIGGKADRAIVATSLVGLSLPQFFLGITLIIVFGVKFGILPTSGGGGVDHLVLPALTLAVPAAGRIAQITRSAVAALETQRYVTAARASGMSERFVLWRRVLPNAAVPITSRVGWELAGMLAGGTIVVETVFAYPGLGSLATAALQRGDIPLVQGVVFVVAAMVATVNLLTDGVFRILDPRIGARG